MRVTSPGIRNDGLDLLRTTGAALVFAGHLAANFGPLSEWFAGGRLGIYLFFPLSGYLLYRPFVAGHVNLRRYAVARAARILPAYYLCLAILGLAGLAPINAATLTLTGNTFDLLGILHSAFGQSWTLGVELAFYALLPLLAVLPGRWLVGIFAASWVLFALTVGTWVFSQIPAQLWAFGLGMLVARRSIPVAWPIGVLLIALGLWTHGLDWPGQTMTAIGAAVLISWAARTQPHIPLVSMTADLSYSVYLWHIGVVTFLTPLLPIGWVLLLVAIPATIGIAWLSWRYVERPILEHVRRSAYSGIRIREMTEPPAVVTAPPAPLF